MATFKVTTMLEPPFVMRNKSGGYEGFIVDMLDKIAEGVDFKYDLQLAKDGKYGGMEADGSWNGMIGEVVRREVDMAAAPLTVTSAREQVIHFSKPFLSNSVRLLVRKPRQPEFSIFSMFEVFSYEMWFCICIAAILVSLLFMLIGRFDPYEWRQVPSDKDPRGARHSFGLRDSLMFVFSTLFLQGYRETPKSLAGRTLAVTWFAFLLPILAAYIANIGPYLQVPARMTPHFSDIEDLAKQTYMRVGAVKSGSTFNKLKSSKDPVYSRLAGMIAGVESTKQGVDRVREGGFVMLTESLYGKYVAETDPSCSLMMYGPSLFPSDLSLALPKNSPLRARVDLMILQMQEDGTLQHLQEKWWRKGMCENTDMAAAKKRERGPFVSQLNLRNIAGPFILLTIGSILSVVLMVGEYMFKKLRQ